MLLIVVWKNAHKQYYIPYACRKIHDCWRQNMKLNVDTYYQYFKKRLQAILGFSRVTFQFHLQPSSDKAFQVRIIRILILNRLCDRRQKGERINQVPFRIRLARVSYLPESMCIYLVINVKCTCSLSLLFGCLHCSKRFRQSLKKS